MAEIQALVCPECNSRDLEVEDVEIGETGRVWCPDCGYESEAERIPLAEVFAGP